MGRIIFFFMCICFLHGCMNPAQVKKGDSLLLSGNPCDADEAFEEALKIKPKLAQDRDFAENSLRAKQQCSTAYYLKGSKLVESGHFSEAIQELEKAIELHSGNSKAKETLSLAKAGKAENEKKSEEYFRRGLQYIEGKNWDKAVSEMWSALALNSSHENARTKISEIDAEIKKAEILYKEALSLIDAKQLEKAIEVLNRVVHIHPFYSGASDKLNSIKIKLEEAEKQYDRGRELVSKKAVDEAEACFAETLKLYPHHNACKESLASILYQKAREHESRELTGSAIAAYLRILDIMPTYQDTKARLSILEEGIRQRIIYRVALIPFKNYSSENGVADAVYERVLKYISQQKQSSIEIIDREELRVILDEQKLSLSGLIESESVIPAGKIKGVDAVITGKLLSYKVAQDVNTESRFKKYQSGTVQKYNPEYDKAVQNLRNAEQSPKASSTFGAVLSGLNIGLARAVLNETPQYIDEPVYSNWHYKIIHHKKTALIKVSSRLINTRTGNVLFSEIADEEISASDDTVDNANPDLGILS